ncbi:MAG: hypothetical protein NUV94_05770 [Candidatus Acetothermia bacterium]|jgi:hypothetical protein|nr:hypothetical protein [Candidatus Acetothermia bacterium]
MRRLAALAVALVLIGAAAAGEQVRLLIVDETKTLEESVRLEALARGLRASGVFQVQAMLKLPTEPWQGEPFHFVLVLPAHSRFAWLCAPGPVQYLPEPLQRPYHGLAQGVHQAFAGRREVRGPGDDLWPFLLSGYLQHFGVLHGGM